jgi:DNA-binding transcriptional LysR family regulator
MTLKQLEAFYWAATCTNFATAAERMNLSTSSLSKRIGELERSLSTELFDRSGRWAALTPAGHRLLPLAGDLLQHADRVVQTLGKKTGLQGVCRLGVGELGSVTFLPRWVRALRTAHPALSINIEVDVSEALSLRLARGEIDAAVVGANSAYPQLLSTTIAQAEFVWCASPALARRIDKLDAQGWETQTLVSLPRRSNITDVIDAWMLQNGARPAKVLTCNRWGSVAGLIANGEGIGILPDTWAVLLRQQGAIQILESGQKLEPLTYQFQARHDDVRPIIAALRSSCIDIADFSFCISVLAFAGNHALGADTPQI